MRAADPAADPAHGSGAPHTIAKIYWNRVEREVLEAAFDRLRTTAPDAFPGIAAVADVPGVTDAEQITAEIDASAYAGAKSAAMRAHATQIPVDGPVFALSNDLGQPLLTTERTNWCAAFAECPDRSASATCSPVSRSRAPRAPGAARHERRPQEGPLPRGLLHARRRDAPPPGSCCSPSVSPRSPAEPRPGSPPNWALAVLGALVGLEGSGVQAAVPRWVDHRPARLGKDSSTEAGS
ncbi:1D-myo-inositol 2-acetamido-2-deoxy-alpha-D-glucopyranoside deacetylase [Streptomyces badius]